MPTPLHSPTRLQHLRHRIEHIIFDTHTPESNLFDVVLIWLIIASVVSVMLESVTSIRLNHGEVLRRLEWFFTAIFSVEYLLRLWTTRHLRRYVTSFFGIIDLLTLLPSYLSIFFVGAQYLLVIRSLRLLRVFRVLKLVRYLDAASNLRDALAASRAKITVFLGAVLTLVVIIGTLIYIVEGEENGFRNIPVSIYWTIVTLTTVGYGDISPRTPLGQVLASVLMIIGYGIIAVPTGIVTAEISQQNAGKGDDGSRQDTRQDNGARGASQDDGAGYQVCKLCSPQDHPARSVFCRFCGAHLKLTRDETLYQEPRLPEVHRQTSSHHE